MEDIKRENRIAEALEMRNMKQIELAERTGIPRGTINNWIAQRYQPKATPLAKMSKVLCVSDFWLAGYDIPMERPAEQVKGDKIAALSDTLRKDDRLANLIFSIVSLTDSQLDSVENLVNEFSKLNQK